MNNHEEESRALLSSLSDLPGPSPQAVDSILQRTLAGVGVGVGAGVLAETEASATIASSGTASATSGHLATLLVSFKVKAVVAIGLLSITGVAVYQASQSGSSESISQVVVPDTTPTASALKPPVQVLLEEQEWATQPAATPTPSEKVQPTIKAPIDKETTSPQKAKAQTKARPSGSEREIIQAARVAISTSDSRAAIRALKEHKRFYSRGDLAEEREVLWISLLARDAKLARAQKRAARFHTRFPGSLHRARINAEIEAATKKHENNKPVTDSGLPGQQ